MSPESGNISPIMCLMSTLLPVPEGPSTTVIVSVGNATLRPLRTGTPPRRLCTSTQRIDCFLSGSPDQIEVGGVVLEVVVALWAHLLGLNTVWGNWLVSPLNANGPC